MTINQKDVQAVVALIELGFGEFFYRLEHNEDGDPNISYTVEELRDSWSRVYQLLASESVKSILYGASQG
jgi:hypothetical protein